MLLAPPPPFTQNAVDVKGFVPRLAWCSPSLPASLLAPGYSRWRSGCREGSLAPLKTRIRDPFRRPGSWQQFRPSPPSTGILGLQSHPLSPAALKRNEVTTHLHFYTRQAGGVPRDFIYMMILPGKIKPTASSWWSLFAPTHPEMGTSFGEKNEAFYNTQQSCQRYFDVSFIAQPVFRSVLFLRRTLSIVANATGNELQDFCVTDYPSIPQKKEGIPYPKGFINFNIFFSSGSTMHHSYLSGRLLDVFGDNDMRGSAHRKLNQKCKDIR